MRQLSVMVDDAVFEGLDLLVSTSDGRDRSYFVRLALFEFLKRELPKTPKQNKEQDLRDLLQMRQSAPDAAKGFAGVRRRKAPETTEGEPK